MGRELQAASNSHAMPGTLTGGTRRHRAHPLRALVAIATAILVFQAGYVAPVAAAPARDLDLGPVAPAADPPVDETPVLDPADEVTEARTETTRTYALGDGRYAVEAFADPVFYQPDGSADWLPIDLDFTATDKGARVAVTKTPVQVTVGASGDGLVAVEHEGYRISLRPIAVAPAADPNAPDVLEGTAPAADPGAADLSVEPVPVALAGADVAAAMAAPVTAGPPVAERQRADLPDVLPGVGLRVFAHPYGSSNFLVLAEPLATTSWTFAVSSPGLVLVPGTDGALDFVDEAGKAFATMPAPYAVDSTPDELTGSGRTTTAAWYTLSALGSQQLVTVSVDPAWLVTAVYPVYVDPSITVYNEGTNANGDVHVNEGNPTFRYQNYQRPDSPYYYEMWLGESPSNSSYFNMAFIGFGLSEYNGTVVDSATLEVRPYHQYYDAPTSTRTWLRRVTASWTEDINWNEKPTKTDTGMTHADCVEGAPCAFDITAMVADWRDGDQPDYGVRLDEIDSSGNRKGPTYWKRLIAAEQGTNQRPRLLLTYHVPVSVTSPDGGVTARTAGRTLAWATEPGWGQDMYRVDVSTQSDFSSILVTSDDVAGTASAWAIPTSTSLTPDTTYYWRVRARRTTSRTPTPTTMWSQYAEGSFTHDPGANLGIQPQHTFESFDLGAGDSLAVNVATGNLVLSHPIVDLPIRGGSLPIALTYNSQDIGDVGLGAGWRLNVQRGLAISGSSATFTDADGARHVFTLSGGVYTAPKTIYATLTRTTGTPNVYTLTWRDRSVDVFHELSTNTAYLKQAKDRFGNTGTFGYSGTTLTSATDPANRQVTFTWTSSIVTITDWANVSGGVVQTSGSGNRSHRIFLAGGTVSGWADPLNTAGSCPTGGSHLTCLTLTGGLVSRVSKTQTYETLTAGALGTATRAVHTDIAYAGTEVASVKDAEQVAAGGPGVTFERLASALVEVVRPGSPASTTRYVLAAATDPYARVTGVKRLLGTSTWIEARTAYDASYPIEPASVIENYVDGSPSDTAPDEDRITAYTYVASSMGLLSRLTEPLTASTHRTTDYTYNANNDVTQQITALDGSGTIRTVTRFCYDASCATSGTGLALLKRIDNYKDGTAGGTNGNVEDVTTSYEYDTACAGGTTCGQRTRETRANYASGGTLLDQAATGWTYDSLGNQTAEIRNYANGTVTNPGDDITPNATTNARTDLTIAYVYDTAGNQITNADPRRAIIEEVGSPTLGSDDYRSTTTYDARNQAVTTRLPTTPGQSDCANPPACRQTTTAYDELGLARRTVGVDGTITATLYDAAGRATETYTDDDGDGGTAARISGRSGYDVAGRVLWTEDAVQANDPGGGTDPGRTEFVYDELGRTLSVTEAAGSASPAVASTTVTGYDALDRTVIETVGTESPDAQTTRWTYDLAGRVLDENDGFTCTSSTYDYRDQPVSIAEGRAGGTSCSGSATRTIAQAFDALDRLTGRTVSGTGIVLEANQHDAAGRVVATTASDGTTDRVTETTWNALDEATREYRYTQPAGGGTRTGETWARSNRDPAGNETDRCTWAATPAEWCHLASDVTWASPQPITRSSSEYDAHNNRVKQYTPGLGTTTYDPAAGYQVKGVFLPTAAGREHQTLYGYDPRDRLDTITVLLCTVSEDPCQAGNIVNGTQRVVDDYEYDENDNRTSVVEDNGSGAVTRTYGYDGRNQLIGDSAGGTGCANGQAYAYDAAGNRTCASGRTFGYVNGTGLLESCTGTACAPVHDADGRLTRLTTASGTWSYVYDAEGRLTSACQSASCTGTGFARLDATYDGEGHRIGLTETPASGPATTTVFTYGGDAVGREVATTGSVVVTRTFTTDEAGAIVKMTRATTGGSTADDGTYLVVWNGHGDAVELLRIDPDTGALAPANRFSYDTWGTPTLVTVGTFGDVGFRYRYVGRFDVQWDSSTAVPAGLLYMHARHYSPEIGRFLQPDPSAMEANLYAYAENSPVTLNDCTGLYTRECAAIAVRMMLAQLQILSRWIAIRENRGVGDGPLPMAGPRGRTTVATHQEKLREWQRNAQRYKDEWKEKCTGGDGPRLPPGFFDSLSRWISEPTPSPLRQAPRFRPRMRVVPVPFWMYLLWPWQGVPCLMPGACGGPRVA